MAGRLNAMDSIPISELNPEISKPTTKSIKAIVTLIWPYSSSNENLTVSLADPDVRLRRAQGQVRVSFQGSSARTVYDAGIGSGDEVAISLDGVEWVKYCSTSQAPGRGIDWELKFTERLVMEIRESESQKVSTIDIDYPTPIESYSVIIPPTTEPDASQTELRASITSLVEPTKINTDEWSSPALTKRAKLSYKHLIPSNYDIFTEGDGTVPGKGRKRAKFSRKNSSWRYSSRSPSPEKSDGGYTVMIGNGNDFEVDTIPGKPAMLDESCQTMDLEQDADESLESLTRQTVEIGHEIRTPMEDLFSSSTNQTEKSKTVATTISPLIPHLLIDPESQDDIDHQRNIGNASSPSSSPLLHPVPSEGLSLASPLVSSSSRGLPPHPNVYAGWEERPINQSQSSQTLEFHSLGFNTEKPPVTETGYFEAEDHYGHWQGAVVNDQPRGIHKEAEVEKSISYLELGPDEDGLAMTHPGPYFGDNPNSVGPYRLDTNLEIFPNIERDGLYSNAREETNAHFEEDDENDHQGLSAQPALSNFSNIELSRSQSAQSEIVDLTENSDEEEYPFDTDVQLDSVEVDQGLESARFDDESDIEDEDDEKGFNEEIDHIIKPTDDEDDQLPEGDLQENGGSARYSVSFNYDEHSTLQRDGFEIEEESDEGESEVDFEDEEVNSERPQNRQNPTPTNYEVINLMSSDEDEALGAEDFAAYDSEIEGTDVLDDIVADLMDEGPEVEQDFWRGEEEAEGDEEDEETEGEEEKEDDEYEGGSRDDLNHIDGSMASTKDGPVGEDTDKNVNADADADTGMENKESNEYTRISNHAYQHHQELEPENIEIEIKEDIPIDNDELIDRGVFEQSQQTVFLPGGPEMNPIRIKEAVTLAEVLSQNVPQSLEKPTSQNVVGKVHVARPSSHNVKQSVTKLPKILVDLPRNELQTHANQDRSSPASGEEWHDALDSPAEVPRRLPAEGNVQSIVKMLDKEKESFSEVVSVVNITTAISTNREAKTQEDGYNPALGVTQTKDKINFGEDQIGIYQQAACSNQLPTPNATQITAGLSTELSFDSVIPIESEAESRTRSKLTEAISVAIPVNQNVLGPLDNTVNLPVLFVIPRQHMRTRSGTSQQSAKSDGSSSIIMQDSTLSQGYDASAELALDPVTSPTQTNGDMRPPSPTALRTQLTKSLRTNLAEFTPLRNLRLNLELRVEVLAIVTTSTHPENAERAKNGLRHYHVRFNITDPSLNSAVTEVQVFRPYREAIPVVRPGDGILLRSFIVKAEARRGFPLRSEDGSSWAVFKADGTEEMRGPPVEFDDAERSHIASLKHWFMNLDSTTQARLDKANMVKSTSPEKVFGKVH